ncbi:MAG: hypothetical protein CVT49_11950 [candidate division Zixibacteria bacterium HGW-Zixibacteria-1]|nr:MAG: hypothetical protein CVT49_11950 [candidate division Zixibacteria bacterium HGW-Zixibacteria-1]
MNSNMSEATRGVPPVLDKLIIILLIVIAAALNCNEAPRPIADASRFGQDTLGFSCLEYLGIVLEGDTYWNIHIDSNSLAHIWVEKKLDSSLSETYIKMSRTSFTPLIKLMATMHMEGAKFSYLAAIQEVAEKWNQYGYPVHDEGGSGSNVAEKWDVGEIVIDSVLLLAYISNRKNIDEKYKRFALYIPNSDEFNLLY